MAIYIPIVSEFKSAGIEKAKKEFKSLEGFSAKASFAIRKAALPAAAAVAGIGAALFDATKSAMEDAAAQDLLANNLRKTTGATDAQIAANEDWIATQGRLLGISDSELRPALSKLAKATGSVTKAQNLTTKAMDIAQSTGRPLSSVVSSLEKAYGGNMSALAKLAPEYRQLIKDGGTFEEVMDKIAKTTGGAASEAANTTAGRMKRLGVAFDEVKEGVGTLFLPLLEKLAVFLTEKVLPAFEKFQKLIEDEGFLGAFEKLGEKLWDWIQPQIKPMLKKLAELIGAAAIWLVNVGIPKLVRKLDDLGEKFIDWIEPRIGPMLDELGKMFGRMVEWIVREGIPKLAGLAVDVAIALGKWFIDLAPKLIEIIGKMLLEVAKGLGRGALDLGASIGKAIANGIITGINKGIDGINALAEVSIDVPLGPDLDFNPPNIPHIPLLANGGIVNSPGGILAMVGEKGPEAVIPLDRLGEFGGGINIHVTTGVGDPVAIGREVSRVLAAYERRNGRAA